MEYKEIWRQGGLQTRKKQKTALVTALYTNMAWRKISADYDGGW